MHKPGIVLSRTNFITGGSVMINNHVTVVECSHSHVDKLEGCRRIRTSNAESQFSDQVNSPHNCSPCLSLTPSRSTSGEHSLTTTGSTSGSFNITQSDEERTNLLRQTFYVLKSMEEVSSQLRENPNMAEIQSTGLGSSLTRLMAITIPLIFRLFGLYRSDRGRECTIIGNQVLKDIYRLQGLVGRVQRDLRVTQDTRIKEAVATLDLREIICTVWDYMWAVTSYGEAFVRAQRGINKCRAKIESSLIKMIAIGAGCHDPQRRVCVHQVQICDFFGGEWSLPRDLCIHREVFRQILLFQFEGGPAEEVITLGLFNVFRGHGSKLINNANWTRAIEISDSLQLSVVVPGPSQSQTERARAVSAMTCPQCNDSQAVASCQDGWAICVRCNNTFHVAQSSAVSTPHHLVEGLIFKRYSVLQIHNPSVKDVEQNVPLISIPPEPGNNPDTTSAVQHQAVTNSEHHVTEVHTPPASNEDSPQQRPEVCVEGRTSCDDGFPDGHVWQAKAVSVHQEDLPRCTVTALGVIAISSTRALRQSLKVVMGWQNVELPPRISIRSADLWRLLGRIRNQPANFMIVIHHGITAARAVRLCCQHGAEVSSNLLEKLSADDTTQGGASLNPEALNLGKSVSMLDQHAQGIHSKFRLLRTAVLDMRKEIIKILQGGERSDLLARLSRHFSKDVRICEDMLGTVQINLQEIGDSLDLIVEWWHSIESEAKRLKIHHVSRQLMPGANNILLNGIKDGFLDLKSYLSDYLEEMHQLYENNIRYLNRDNLKHLSKVRDCTHLVVSARGQMEPRRL